MLLHVVQATTVCEGEKNITFRKITHHSGGGIFSHTKHSNLVILDIRIYSYKKLETSQSIH